MNSRVRNSVWEGILSASRPELHSESPFAILPFSMRTEWSGSLPANFRDEFFVLGSESNPEIFQEGMLSLARRLESAGHSAAAQSFYNFLRSQESASESVRNRAEAFLGALQGQGPWNFRAEALGRTFAQQVTDPALVGGMVLAGGVFQATRLASFSRLAASSRIGFWTRGIGAQSLAWGTGLALEVPAFTFGVRGINALRGLPQDWSGQALGLDLLSNAVTLFALKAAGAFSHGALSRMRSASAANSTLFRISERVLPQAAMFTGILAAHAAETRLGLRGSTGAEAAFLESLVTLLHFNVAGRLIGNLGASRWEGDYRRVLHGTNSGRPSRPLLQLPLLSQPAFEGGKVARPGRSAHDFIFAMGKENDPSNGAPQSGGIAPGSSGIDKAARPLPFPGDIQSHPFYLRLSEAQAGINLPMIMETENPLWVHAMYRQALEMYAVVNRIDSQWGPEFRRAPFETTLHSLKSELRSLGELLRTARFEETPPYQDPVVKEMLRNLYVTSNATIAFLVAGGNMGLEKAAQNVRLISQQLTNLVPPQPDAASDPASWLTPRPWLDPLSSEFHARSEHYSYPSDTSDINNWLEIPGRDQLVFLMGSIPDIRADLSNRHYLRIKPNEQENGWELMGRANLHGVVGRIRPVRDTSPVIPADYLEAYDAIRLQDLEGAGGPEFLRTRMLNHLKPGGIGYIVSRDPQVIPRLIDVLAKNNLADIFTAATSSRLPVKTNRRDAASSNFVFIQRLKDPE